MKLPEIAEQNLHLNLFNYFSKWFDIRFEVCDDTNKSRIDLLMYHNSDKQRERPFGIEVKGMDQKRGTEIGAWCVQAKRYAETTFDEGKRAYIFTAPQISGYYLEEGARVSKHNVENSGMGGAHHNINPFLYRSFGIGEVQKFNSLWPTKTTAIRLVMNTRIIWRSDKPYEIDEIKLAAL